MRARLPAATVSAYVGGVPPGTRVPLSRLPRLPQRGAVNTATQAMLHSARPFAANGAYITLEGNACFSFGDQFPVNCSLRWTAEQMPATDTKQDYVIMATNGDELTGSATATGATYTATTGTQHQTTLSAVGTYIFGTYDVTTSQWIAVIYANAGQVVSVDVFADPYHSQQSYQFTAGQSNDAYIYLTNLSQSDYYVVGVEQTGVAPNCVFMGPAPLPSPYAYPSNQLCNLTASSGIQAPNGDLSVTWPLSSSLPGGSYTVEVFDITQGYRIGQAQVSLTSASGIVLQLYADTSGASVDASPYPANVATTTTNTVAWEGYYSGGGDQSVSGVKGVVTGLTNGSNYQWDLIDPQGEVMSTPAATVASNTVSHVFTFNTIYAPAPYMLNPGQYSAQPFVLELYDTTHKDVVASQSFTILGYATQTQFSGGSLSSTLSIAPGSSAVTSLRITNTSDAIYNGAGDSISKIEFTSGNDFNLSSATGTGIMVSTNSGAVAPCAVSCTATTAPDSNGNLWNVQVTCSAGGLTADGECNVVFTPSSNTVSLTPGAYITLSNVTFFADATASCGNSCATATSEIPTHGLQWSESLPSYTPVYFASTSATQSATAEFRIAGSSNLGTRNLVTLSPPGFSVPFVGNHYFRSEFGQLDYDIPSPYNVAFSLAVANSNDDVLAYTIKNTGANTITEVAFQLPSLFISQGYTSVDSLSSSSWTATTCPASLNSTGSTAWSCYSGSIASGSSATIYIDQSMTMQSFAFQEINVQAEANSTWFSVPAASGTSTTPDGAYSVDNLAFAAYSLLGSDMTAYFSPNTVGSGSTATLGFTVQNTSTGIDPNPDSVDAIVIEAPSTGLSLGSTPTVSKSGWSYLGSFKLNGATATQYWFGLCSAQFTTGAQQSSSYGGPPAANASPFALPLTAPYNSLGLCGNESQSLGAGASLSVSNMVLSNFSTGAQTWKMYAHGTNGGAWSSAKPFGLTVTPESASVWFNQVNSTTVPTNSTPTIGTSPNTYQYAIENTSQSNGISTIDVTIPGLDINNQNAYDGTTSPGYWYITNINSGGVVLSAPGGQSDGTGGCSVDASSSNTYNATNAGANGQIQVSGCTNFKPGDILYLTFTASSPQVQSDSYVFPATVDGNAAGTAWLGADEVTMSFTLGLNVVVDPTNPGPGGSTPLVSCSQCTFSGSAIDFGDVANNTTYTFSDIIRASIIYSGGTVGGNTLDLYVEASQNPANSTGSPTNELNTEVDSAHSTSGAGVTYDQVTYTPVPTSGMGVLLAAAPETARSSGYDTIESFKLAIGAEALNPYIVTLTYTVIAN